MDVLPRKYLLPNNNQNSSSEKNQNGSEIQESKFYLLEGHSNYVKFFADDIMLRKGNNTPISHGWNSTQFADTEFTKVIEVEHSETIQVGEKSWYDRRSDGLYKWDTTTNAWVKQTTTTS